MGSKAHSTTWLLRRSESLPEALIDVSRTVRGADQRYFMSLVLLNLTKFVQILDNLLHMLTGAYTHVV